MRPLAIELAFDAASDERLSRIWRRLAAVRDGRCDSELGVRPHITLALFRDGEPGDLEDVAAALASDFTSFGLTLSAVACSPGVEGVVSLEPAPSGALARAHTVADRLLGADRGDLVDMCYRPGAWRPRCTMAVGVPEPHVDAVLSACRLEALGDVQVTQVQVVRYRPATLLWETSLRYPGALRARRDRPRAKAEAR